jgi:radical SAM superfamily enzyme YgiQ (UPF0313 family)
MAMAWDGRGVREVGPRFLLVGPWDPDCGEYTFLSPPLGVWRLAGALHAAGFEADVFDPNIQAEAPERAFAQTLRAGAYDVIGFSTTGMTLRFDLALAHLARRVAPRAQILAGGMEATFNPEAVLDLGPIDRLVLGEGEHPLLEIGRRLRAASTARFADTWVLDGVPGTAWRRDDGRLVRIPQPALTHDALRDAIFQMPYEHMPFRAYWQRLEQAYAVDALPHKAAREARLSEIRSIRLATLNYCPLGCTFCSSTNFLTAAQDSTARIARLDADECLTMLHRIVGAFPDVRTVIFQDDIFVFTNDARVTPLCEGILEAKQRGDLPADLQFISTNRIDAMTHARLALMRRAGFRVLGFGVESFSRNVLAEFGKARIYPHVEPMLRSALSLGMTPFLDMILTSPRSRLADLAESVRGLYRWTQAGCEVGAYPYVIPFSGSAMSRDPDLAAHTIYEERSIFGTPIRWKQAAKILPIDPETREAILAVEHVFDRTLPLLAEAGTHLPSRIRSLLWTAAAVPELQRRGFAAPPLDDVLAAIVSRLPRLGVKRERALTHSLGVDTESAHA